MQSAELLRGSRHAAGLTQAELACRAGTSQPAIAAYESGARAPSFATLERLLDGCGCDLQLDARPRVRRGAASLCELAPLIAEDLERDSERDALRLLFGFADDFRGSSRAGQLALIEKEPPLAGAVRFDAALAGVAELFAAEGGIAAPAWVEGSGRFAEPWWFVASGPAFHAYVLAHTPAVLARHGVFMAREVFDRA
ncbi:MAG TPA: helix-turn-helix transcriptional regulator [Solirubrobacteraceae bacterium]|nr:helix-turn-helix transcriptional regulator [Solirubrobacteraceae bacterium]